MEQKVASDWGIQLVQDNIVLVTKATFNTFFSISQKCVK